MTFKKTISETMWCYDCEKMFPTDDYHNCNECIDCNSNHIYRTSSTSFAYAYKNKEKETQLIDFLMHLRKNYTKDQAKKIVTKYMTQW